MSGVDLPMATTATTVPIEHDIPRDPNDPLWEYPQQTIPMSYEEWLAWPGSQRHSEWAYGEAIVIMPGAYLHARLTTFLTTLLRIFVRRRDLGEVLVAPMEMRLTDPDVAREPDVLFIAKGRLHLIDRTRLNGPADLAIEITSDDSVGRDRGLKFDEYQRAGVREYWVADPRTGRQRFDAWILGTDGKYVSALPADDGRYFSTVLPGFWLKPEWLWEDPLPDETVLLEEILRSIGNDK
jgi:Uma2 family endonuclease